MRRMLVVAAVAGMALAPMPAPEAGATVGWERPVKIQSWFEPGFLDLARPEPGVAVAVDGDVVHLVWSRFASGRAKLFHGVSRDGGGTWSDPMRLASTQATDYRLGSMYPAVAASGDEVHVAWVGFNVVRDQAAVFHRVSRDGGASWGPRTRIATSSSFHPVSVVIDGHHIHILFTRLKDGGGRLVAHAVSNDRGDNWSRPRRITPIVEEWDVPVVADAHRGRVHLVYQVRHSLAADALYYRRSDDHGRTWTVKQRVTDRTHEHPCFDLAASQDHVHVAYGRCRDTGGPCADPSLQYRASADAGDTWTKANRLLPIDAAPQVALAADGKYVHLLTAWRNDEEPKALMSADSGATWSDPVELRGHKTVSPAKLAVGANRSQAHAGIVSPKTGDEWTVILRYQRRS